MPAVFISYRRADSASASGRIDDQLVARFGRANVFKDVDSIPPGVDFERYIEDAIRRSHVVLVIIGPRWLNAAAGLFRRRLDDPADFVRIEIEIALRLNVPIIPLLVDGATMPPATRLPASLRPLTTLNALPVRPDPDFHRDMGRVTPAVERLMTGPPPTPPVTPPEPATPTEPTLSETPGPLSTRQRLDEPAFSATSPAAPPLSPQGEGAGGEAPPLAGRIGVKPSRRAPSTLVATISALALIAVVAVPLLSSQSSPLATLFANPSATATAGSGTATAQAYGRTVYMTETAMAAQLAQPYAPDGVGPCDTKDARYSPSSPHYWDWSKGAATCVDGAVRITDSGTLTFYGRSVDFPPRFTASFTLSFHSSSAEASCAGLYVSAGDISSSPGVEVCDNGYWSSYWPPLGSKENQCCIKTTSALTLIMTVNIRTITISVNGQTVLSKKDDAGSMNSFSLQGYVKAPGAWIGVSSFTLTPITT